MALDSPAANFALLLTICCIAAAFGSRALAIFRYKTCQPLDTLLFAFGIGFAALQLLAGIMAFVAGLTAVSAAALLAAMGLSGGSGWKTFFLLCKEVFADLATLFKSGIARAIGVCILFFAALEALLAMAPLTGSDAMHYHFTAPLLQMGRPEQPVFWLTHSFLTGLGHEMIALGLALGGDRLALLLIFTCGCMTAAALLQLARRWMPAEWALAAVLAFLMAPMVFWQISTAGSPDIWMGFYALLAVLAVGEIEGPESHRWIVLAGVYAGAAASIKYTGWILPGVIVLWILWQRKTVGWATLCAGASLVAGVFPLLRNWIWTGDPFFPFLTRWAGKVAMNSFALSSLQADVHSAAFSYHPLNVLYFLATMGVMGPRYGVGNYFGPLVLSFLPLLFFCNWKLPLVRLSGVLWLVMLVANALTTQMARFLLPAFPVALALVFCGAAAASRSGERTIRAGCAVAIALFLLFCVAADSLYARDFVRVSLGRESRDAFLRRMAPDYQAAMFVNSSVAGRPGKVLVFFRHLYYLRVPFVNGDPATSWSVNAELLNTPQALLAFLKENDIRWVVKSPDYPEALETIAVECEAQGKLVPEARTEVELFLGNSRTQSNRSRAQATLLRVAN